MEAINSTRFLPKIFFFAEERHLIKASESLPLFDEGIESVKDVAPIASPDFSITENEAQTLSDYPAFHSAPFEYQQTNVHIEPFYRYRVYSDAS